MSFPEGFTWAYPGFPSIVVSYLKTNDFFFSGYVGLLMILFMEFRAAKSKAISYFGLFVMFYEGFIVLMSRVHYSINIFVGMFFSQYFILIDSLCEWFYKRFLNKKKIAKMEEISADIENIKLIEDSKDVMGLN